jgi:hypothetical protein
MEARDRMTAAGYILIGLAAYGFMFIWAIRCGREEDAE